MGHVIAFGIELRRPFDGILQDAQKLWCDLLAVRHELESSAVHRGCARGSDVAPVQAAFEAFRQERASTERLVELDIAFHRALVEFGGSRFLLTAWLALAPVLQAVITIGNRRLAEQDPVSHLRRIVAAHEPILAPLAGRDAETVVAMLAKQFVLTKAQFVRGDPPDR